MNREDGGNKVVTSRFTIGELPVSQNRHYYCRMLGEKL